MKKISTLLSFLFILFSANAQFQKANQVLGASLYFQSTSSDYNSTAVPQTINNGNFNLSAEWGVAKKENRLSGLFFGTGYGFSKSESSQPAVNTKTSSFSAKAGYFTRGYKSLGKNFYVFADGRAGLDYYQNNYTTAVSGPDSKIYGVTAGLYPGLTYKWNSRFLFELRFADFVSIGYTYREILSPSGIKNFERDFSVGTSLGLGYLSNIGIGARWVIK